MTYKSEALQFVQLNNDLSSTLYKNLYSEITFLTHLVERPQPDHHEKYDLFIKLKKYARDRKDNLVRELAKRHAKERLIYSKYPNL